MTENQPTYQWIYPTESRLGRTSPAVALDGTTYVGGNACRLHAISNQGRPKWKSRVEGMLGNSTVSVADDGVVYIASDTGRLYAFDPTEGELLWSTPKDWLVATSPAVTRDRTAIFGARKLRGHHAEEHRLIAVNPSGEVNWEVAVHGGASDAPAISSDGTIYCVTGHGDIYAITPSGKVEKRCRPGGRISSAPAIGKDGGLFAGTHDGGLYAMSPDMEILWKYRTGEIISYSSPSIAEDGTIYLGSWDHCLYALSKEGELKWSFTTGLYVSSSPAVATDGTIYFGSQDRYFYALFADGSLKWKLWTNSRVVSSPAITEDGVVLICTKNAVVAIGENNGGPARSGWPMLLGNARRNGRQGDPAVGVRRAPQDSELKMLNRVEAIR